MVANHVYPLSDAHWNHEPAKERKQWKRVTKEAETEILRLVRTGLTHRDVASIVGYSPTKVGLVARSHGIHIGKGCHASAAHLARIRAQQSAWI